MTIAVCIGDSITSNDNVTVVLDRFPQTLARLTGMRVINKGIGGNKTSQMLARFATDVVANKPNKIYIMGGANDIDTSIPAETTEANLRAMVDLGLAAGATVYLLTITPATYRGAAANQVQDAINDWIRAQAASNVIIKDAYAALVDPNVHGKLLEAYDPGDHEHPNAAGCLALAQCVADAYGATNTWIASGPGQASNPANWSLGHAPQVGENVVFNSTSVNNCSWDLDLTVAVPNSDYISSVYSGTVTQNSTTDMGVGGGGFWQAGGVFTAAHARRFDCAGHFMTYPGATTTVCEVNLHMLGDDTVINAPNFLPWLLHISANVTMETQIGIASSAGEYVTVDPGKTLTLSGAAIELYWYETSATGLASGPGIQGQITGTGVVTIYIYNTDKTVDLSNINCRLQLMLQSSATANRKLKLARTASVGGPLSVYTLNPTYSCILDLDDKNLFVKGITAGTRGSILFKSGKVVNLGNLDTSAGSADFGTSQYVQAAPGTIKLAANQPMNDLILRSAAVGSSLLSNVVVNGTYAHVPALALGAFTLTKNGPEYTGRRRPVKKLVKKMMVWPSLADMALLEDIEKVGA